MAEKFRFYTLWIAVICVIIFIIQSIFPSFTDIMLLNTNVFKGEIWRFVSSIFFHGSIAHLFYNLVALMFFGFVLEKLAGGKKFLLIFFASGIIANIISVNFYPASLGASGAIMGIIGTLAIIRPFMMVWTIAPLPMIVAAFVYVIIDLFGVFYPMGTGNIAHLSGIAIGVLAGLFIRINSKMGFNIKRKERVNLPENYMRDWEDNFMK